MSLTQKYAQKYTNNPLLTPVDGCSKEFNTDCDESEISFDFGGLKGIMEEIEMDDPSSRVGYYDEDISTKSSSPLSDIYLKGTTNSIRNDFLPRPHEELNLTNVQNVLEKPKILGNSIFTSLYPVNANFFTRNDNLQPIRRKKIKISHILKKKWTTKVPSFIESQKAKLISKINLFKNQKINKYKKTENEINMSMSYYEEKVSTNLPRNSYNRDREYFIKNNSNNTKYVNQCNKFNIFVENSDLNTQTGNLKRRKEVNELSHQSHYGAAYFHLNSFSGGNGNFDNYPFDNSSLDVPSDNFFPPNFYNCIYR